MDQGFFLFDLWWEGRDSFTVQNRLGFWKNPKNLYIIIINIIIIIIIDIDNIMNIDNINDRIHNRNRHSFSKSGLYCPIMRS